MYSVFTAAILEERDNRMIFLWEINFIFMQIYLICLAPPTRRREHTLYGISEIDGIAFLTVFAFLCRDFQVSVDLKVIWECVDVMEK